MNENEKQLQDLEITFKGGDTLSYNNIIGYQIGGSVIAVIAEDNKTVIYPFSDIEKVVIYPQQGE